MFQKQKPWRSEPYLDFVRSLPPVDNNPHIEGERSVAHHLIGVGGLSGVGMKAPDYMTMPMTVKGHAEMHDNPELWTGQWQMICRTIGAAIDAGKLQWRK